MFPCWSAIFIRTLILLKQKYDYMLYFHVLLEMINRVSHKMSSAIYKTILKPSLTQESLDHQYSWKIYIFIYFTAQQINNLPMGLSYRGCTCYTNNTLMHRLTEGILEWHCYIDNVSPVSCDLQWSGRHKLNSQVIELPINIGYHPLLYEEHAEMER